MQGARLQGLFAELRAAEAKISSIAEAYMHAPIGADLELKARLDDLVAHCNSLGTAICDAPIRSFEDAAAKLEFALEASRPEHQRTAISSAITFLRAPRVHAA